MDNDLFGHLLSKVSSADRRFVQKQADLALRIDALRKRRNMSKRSLAEALSVPASYVSRLLSGRANPTLRTITKIEDVLVEEIMPVTTDEPTAWVRVTICGTSSSQLHPAKGASEGSEHRLGEVASFTERDLDFISLS